MKTRRFNWIVLLVGGLLTSCIGMLGMLAGHADRATSWCALGAGFLVGAVVLRRMRLP